MTHFIIKDEWGRTWEFPTPESAAIFLLGRDPRDWHIYRKVELQANTINHVISVLKGEPR